MGLRSRIQNRVTIFEDAEVLTRGHVPSDLPFREKERGRIEDHLGDIIDEAATMGNGYITGLPGTGKTAVVRAIEKEYKAMKADNEHNGVEFVCIWAKGQTLRSHALELAEMVGVHANFTSMDAQTILREIGKHLLKKEMKVLVVAIDDVHRAEEASEIVSTYLDASDVFKIPTNVFLISNNLDYMDEFETRETSREDKSLDVHFEPYTKEQMVGIVEARAKAALVENAITIPTIEKLVDLIVERNGYDVRAAIDALRAVALEAKSNGRAIIQVDDLNAAIIAAQIQEARESIRKQDPKHRQTITCLAAVHRVGADWAPIGVVHDMMRDLAKSIGLAKTPHVETVRTYLIGLEASGFVETKDGVPKRGRAPKIFRIRSQANIEEGLKQEEELFRWLESVQDSEWVDLVATAKESYES